MKFLIVIPPREFKDESLFKSEAMFKKWGVEIVVASIARGECQGYHGATAKAQNMDQIKVSELDGIFLVDGPGVDTYKLYDYRPLLDKLIMMANSNRIVAGLGNSIKIMARANIISGKRVSVPRENETVRLVTLYKGKMTQNPIEKDGIIITAASPESAELLTDEILKTIGMK